jgi:hypothetical protein
MSRQERLERWASGLERHGGPLNALMRIEHLRPADFRAYQGPNTPLTVAFEDPVLRSEGLASDRLGDVLDFFEITKRDAHRLLCDCHYRGAMTGTALAARIRHQIRRDEFRARWKQALRGLVARFV